MESLHLSHLCTQLVSGLLTGANQQNKRDDRCWKKHILSCKTGDEKKTTVVNFFTRLEFQDGSRKQATQIYHGSGRPHLHCLLWLEDVADIELDKSLSATLPADETQAAYVKGSQDSRDGDSMWEIHDGPSTYDANASRLHLHHTRGDSEAGRRAYFPDIMEALKCHQWGVGTQSRGLRHLVTPDGSEITSELKAYMKSKWRHDDMSFLEFLRKTTHKGAIAGWLKKLWKERPEEQMHLTETEFANEYTMRGEQLVAVDTVWRHNDKFFRQWVLKHVPFRKKEDLDVPEVTARLCADQSRVPPHLHNFWNSSDRIRKEMKDEAHTEDHIEETVALLAGHRTLIEQFWTGELDMADDPGAISDPVAAATEEAERARREDSLKLNALQGVFEREIAKHVTLALRATRAQDETELEAALPSSASAMVAQESI
ncbi:unnamed protein product [Prorocentrum cordatum]|uniref:Helitron helicase-like domain-containing protein n=1 Tax=Prorocentrum cordatum TaxID=2364126 RepID=A0ABN9W064_9DINO|nr:unnamed protein product [Polarella glacialis]